MAAQKGVEQCQQARALGGQLTQQACAQCKWVPGVQQKSSCLATCGVQGTSNMNTAAELCVKGIETCMEGCQPSGETGKCHELKIMLKQAAAEMAEYTSISGQALQVATATGGVGAPGTNPVGSGITLGDAAKGLAIGGALAAVTAGIISATSGNKGGQSQQQQQQQQSTPNQPSLQPLTPAPTDPVAQAGCGTKADAHRYSVCNEYYAKNCSATSTDAACQSFFVRYCGTGQAALGTQVDSLTADKTGEGMGQPICSNIVAKQYCAVAGRGACPSCQNVNSQASPSCTNQSASTNPNPNLCVPQLDQAQKDAAKVTCPTDPLFMNPSFTQVATGTTSGLPQIVIASVGGKWRDVASENSPSVFNLSSSTMQQLCAQGKLNCP